MLVNARKHCTKMIILLPSATKLRQGNVFTNMCQEFCPGGGRLCSSIHHRSHDWVGLSRGGLCSAGLCPGGLCPGVSESLCPGSLWESLSGRVSVQGGLCLGGSLSRGIFVQGVSGSLCLGGVCPGGLC